MQVAPYLNEQTDIHRTILEERSQATARASIGLLVFCYISYLVISGALATEVALFPLLVTGAIALYGVTLVVWLRSLNVVFLPIRQAFSIVVDIGGVCYGLYSLGDWGAVIYPLLLWVIVGNGMRFGLKYMAFAMSLAGVLFLGILQTSPYWQVNQPTGIGLLLSVFVLPLFYLTLIRRLHKTNLELEKQLAETAYLANHDPLTKVANRMAFHSHLQQVMQQASTQKGRFALLFIDLDKFKAVNDDYGHHVGDALLCEVAARLNQTIGPADLVARLGGDEFGLVVVKEPEGVEQLKQHLVAVLNKPYLIESKSLHVGASIGMARYPQDGEDMDVLIRHSDQLMYSEKRQARDYANVCVGLLNGETS